MQTLGTRFYRALHTSKLTPSFIFERVWQDWGLNGFFHIARGSDECGIEDECNAGTPAH